MADFTVTGDWTALVPGATLNADVSFQLHGNSFDVPGDVRAKIIDGKVCQLDGTEDVALEAPSTGTAFYWVYIRNATVNGIAVEQRRFLIQAASAGGSVDLSALAPRIFTAIDGSGSDSGDYATQTYVDTAIANSGHATTTYVDNAVADLASQSDLSNAVADLVSTSDLSSALASYYTSTQVDSAISSAVADLVTDDDLTSALSNRPTTTDMNTAISSATSGLASESFVTSQIASATADLVSTSDLSSAVADLVTDSELSSALANRPTTTQMNSAISDATSGLASESYVDSAVAAKVWPVTDGAPTDSAPDGSLAIDGTNSVLYARVGGEWVALTGTAG